MSGHFLNELRAVFDSRGFVPALVFQNRTYSYDELNEHAMRCAAWLQQSGVQPGDRVTLFTAEKLPFLIAQLGALYAAQCHYRSTHGTRARRCVTF